MLKRKSALTLAEGSPSYKTDVNVVFRNERDKKDFVLRTTLDEIGIWRTKHGVAMSGFKVKGISPNKWAAVIEKEYWVFGINCTKAEDIVAAVKIGMQAYNVKAGDLLSSIYIKNLNVEHENQMTPEVRIKENQKLYEGVCGAVIQAAKLLGVQGSIDFHVFSNKKNHKIPKENLHMALRNGGAETVETDEKTKYIYSVASNDGKEVFDGLISHLHLAKIKV